MSYTQSDVIQYFIDNPNNLDIERDNENIFTLVSDGIVYTIEINSDDVKITKDSTYLDVEEFYISFSDAIGYLY